MYASEPGVCRYVYLKYDPIGDVACLWQTLYSISHDLLASLVLVSTPYCTLMFSSLFIAKWAC
jgi:hypothetical protein